jgi:glycosyltransferase involved in cell wall biosynthesis
MLNLANMFSAHGYKVDLVLIEASGNLIKHLSSDVRVVCLNSSRLRTCLFSLIRYLRRYRPAVLLSGMTRSNIVALTASKLSLTDTPVIISEHTTVSCMLRELNKINSVFLRFQIRKFYRYAASIICVSTGVALDLEQVLGADPGTIRVIHNPVIGDDTVPLSFGLVAHPWLLNRSGKIVLSVGRLTKAKDYITLIQSFQMIKSRENIRLIILGEGELRSELHALIVKLGMEGRISLPGYVENPYAYMRQSDLFVLSSRWEGFGNVLVEAMACNIPIVSTNCPNGPAEILEDGKWGTLVPVGNSVLLAEAILRGLKEGRSNFEDRAAQFTIEKAGSAYLKVLLDAASKKS